MGGTMAYREVTPDQAMDYYRRGDVVFLDVRTGTEWLGGHIPGAVHIPLDQLSRRYDELDPVLETLVICSHGVRSATAGLWLHDIGFERVANVRHGICRWPGPLEYGL
jgi:rhodanese-related sulfurtransferase